MRTYPARTGPFPEALHYDVEEIESLCLSALADVALLPPSPSPVRIDRFVEKRFGLTPEYRDDLPRGILGFSEIDASGPLRIVLNPSLTERRLRTTIAHEAGHCEVRDARRLVVFIFRMHKHATSTEIRSPSDALTKNDPV